MFRPFIERLIPKSVRRRIIRASRWPRVGHVDFGELRRVSPISRSWGGDRGTPVDRYYIENFLSAHAEDIRGRVLEIGGDVYSRRYGGDRVDHSDVLDATKSSAKVSIVADLSDAADVPSDVYDCMICTQTLQMIPSIERAVGTIARILKPGGVALVTCPTISKLETRWADYWRVTSAGAQQIFESFFEPTLISISAPGSVLTAVCLLQGVAAEELTSEELEHVDPEYELLVTIRAEKSSKGAHAEDGD